MEDNRKGLHLLEDFEMMLVLKSSLDGENKKALQAQWLAMEDA